MATTNDPSNLTPHHRGRHRIVVIAVVVSVIALAGLGLIAYANSIPFSRPGGCCGGPQTALSAGEPGMNYSTPQGEVFPTTFSIQSVSSGVTLDSLSISLVNAAGLEVPYADVGVLDVTGCWVGNHNATSGTWLGGAPPIAPIGSDGCRGPLGPGAQLNSGDQIWLLADQSLGGQGFQLQVSFGNAGPYVTAAIP